MDYGDVEWVSGQNKIFGIEHPVIFQDYPSNNFSAKSQIQLVIGLAMGLLVTFVIEYLFTGTTDFIKF